MAVAVVAAVEEEDVMAAVVQGKSGVAAVDSCGVRRVLLCCVCRGGSALQAAAMRRDDFADQCFGINYLGLAIVSRIETSFSA